MTDTTEPTPPPSAQAPAGRRTWRAPSARTTAVLAAAMLGVGVAVGAAIGPAPPASLAVGTHLPLPLLLRSLLASAEAGHAAATQPPAILAQPTPRARHRRRAHKTAASAQSEGGTTNTSTSETSTPSSTAPTSTGKTKTVTLPPATHVWLIELTGSTFAGALESPSGAPYINTQAAPTGTTLSDWSAIDAGAFADDAALLAGSPPQLVDTILQPPCPEGAAGATCAAGTPGALSAADEFLKATVPTITASTDYRSDGLIVVTFGSIAAGAAGGLPSGSTSATLTSQPAGGVLLISPFVTAGASSSIAFNPASPEQSLEKLLHP